MDEERKSLIGGSKNLFLKFCVHFRRLESGCRIVCERGLFDEVGWPGTLSISWLLFRPWSKESLHIKNGSNRLCLNVGVGGSTLVHSFLTNLLGAQNTGKWNTLIKRCQTINCQICLHVFRKNSILSHFYFSIFFNFYIFIISTVGRAVYLQV